MGLISALLFFYSQIFRIHINIYIFDKEHLSTHKDSCFEANSRPRSAASFAFRDLTRATSILVKIDDGESNLFRVTLLKRVTGLPDLFNPSEIFFEARMFKQSNPTRLTDAHL